MFLLSGSNGHAMLMMNQHKRYKMITQLWYTFVYIVKLDNVNACKQIFKVRFLQWTSCYFQVSYHCTLIIMLCMNTWQTAIHMSCIYFFIPFTSFVSFIASIPSFHSSPFIPFIDSLISIHPMSPISKCTCSYYLCLLKSSSSDRCWDPRQPYSKSVAQRGS